MAVGNFSPGGRRLRPDDTRPYFHGMTQRLEFLAPAKINLGLEILLRRSDGFHDLNTVFATLAFGDTLQLGPRGDHAITCSVVGAVLAADDSNLAVRAAGMLRERLGLSKGLEIIIEKRIPMGAGLGGGSSDAAAVLMGAPIIWNLDAPADVLHSLAIELGSDVPFFLVGGLALAGSRGERLGSLTLQLPWHVLLVNPGIHVSTPEAFAAVARHGERVASDLAAVLEAGIRDHSALQRGLVNDFEEAVFAMHPELAAIKRRLYEAGALLSLMSGSGATLFGLFESREAALCARGAFTPYWTEVTSFLEPTPER